MESSNCKCKHSHTSSPWNIDNHTMTSSSEHQFKPYPVQKNYPVQQYYNTGLTYQPGSSNSAASCVPSTFSDAVGSFKIEIVEEMLRSDPSLVHERGFNGQSPLHRACLRGDPAFVDLLIRYKADLNVENDFSETPLHFACKRASLVVIHNLIQHGARLDVEDRAGKGAVHHAAHGGSVLMMHYLLDACKLNPFVCDRNISTPMHIICTHGHIELFDYFLKKERCDPFSKDAQGNTLLHVAASNGSGWMCWQLLEKCGYSLLREINGEGCTALDLAKRGCQPKYTEVVRLLSYYSRRPEKTGPIAGPVLAWYGLFLLPIATFPLTLLVSNVFTNQGPITLIGVLFILALRFFHSHRMNHVTRWPSPAHAGLFLAGLIFTLLCYYFQLLPYLYSGHMFLVCLTVSLNALLIYFYSILLTRDPGVITRSMQKTDAGSQYSIVDVALGNLHPERFCTVCEIIPPQLSSHCRLCNKCNLHIDHHCLYLYRCVAVNNHRVFVFFNFIVLLAMVLFEYSCILYMQVIFPERELEWALVSVIFASHPTVWALFVLNAFSVVWVTWLFRVQMLTIAKGRVLAYQPYYTHSILTTRQRIMNVYHFVLNKEPYARDDVCNA